LKNSALLLSLFLLFNSCVLRKNEPAITLNNVERIVKTLSSDEMQGRAIFTPGIEKAARFIENEFKEIGLQPMAQYTGFRQEFSMTSIKPLSVNIKVNGTEIQNDQLMVVTDRPNLSWSDSSNIEILYIKAGESFTARYRSILALNKPVIVLVDEQFLDAFNRLRQYFISSRVLNETNEKLAAVFIIGAETVSSYDVKFTNLINKEPLFNIVGIIPGKSKPEELVIFSGHYDHLGVIDPLEGDSIANGADDDASGITAVISLARYYKKLNNNERSILFVAFTGEESGMLGSKYFSQKLIPESVTAMFNIEMIGKESKFGKNSAFITGYDKSDFGEILQKSLENTPFKFYPDPYTEQQLFYRSDNATLAALGVPAHTISTDKIDIDKFYHTVDDEVQTLDIENITATINAIALSSRSIISGIETPKRIPPLAAGSR